MISDWKPYTIPSQEASSVLQIFYAQKTCAVKITQDPYLNYLQRLGLNLEVTNIFFGKKMYSGGCARSEENLGKLWSRLSQPNNLTSYFYR